MALFLFFCLRDRKIQFGNMEIFVYILCIGENGQLLIQNATEMWALHEEPEWPLGFAAANAIEQKSHLSVGKDQLLGFIRNEKHFLALFKHSRSGIQSWCWADAWPDIFSRVSLGGEIFSLYKMFHQKKKKKKIYFCQADPHQLKKEKPISLDNSYNIDKMYRFVMQ